MRVDETGEQREIAEIDRRRACGRSATESLDPIAGDDHDRFATMRPVTGSSIRAARTTTVRGVWAASVVSDASTAVSAIKFLVIVVHLRWGPTPSAYHRSLTLAALIRGDFPLSQALPSMDCPGSLVLARAS